jgi:putative ABC transport system permease protein
VTIGHNIRHAARSLLASWGNTLVAVASLGLAIGATAAALSIVNALFGRDLAVAAPGELVALARVDPDRPDDRGPLLLSQFQEIRARNQVFSHVVAWRDTLLRNVEANGATYLGVVNEVSGDFFAALGVQPRLGRVFRVEEAPADGSGTPARVAVLDYRCWQRRFARDPDVLGKLLVVDGVPVTIVGVMPESFLGLNIVSAPDAIVPIGFDRVRASDGPAPVPSSPNYYVAARLEEGTTPAAANAFLQSSWPTILEATLPPGLGSAQRTRFLAAKIAIESLRTGTTGGARGLRQQLRAPLLRLIALCALVLVVAYLNLAGLILSRAAARQHELGLRAALGAGRLAIMRGPLLEAALVSATGAMLGVGAAFWTGPMLLQSLLRSQPLRPLAFDASPDARVLALAIGTSIAIGLLCALVPTWQVVGRDPASILRQQTRAVRGGATRLQKAVICVQVSLAFVLTTGAMLFARSLYNLHALEPGFRTAGLLTMELLPQVKHQTVPNRTAYYKELAEALSGVPGIESVSYALVPALDPAQPTAVSTSQIPPTEAIVDPVGPGFFRTLGVRMIAGREFDWHDDERAPRVAVVSDSLAAQLFPGKDPIGQTLDVPALPYAAGVRIVGVADSASLWKLQNRRPRAAYLALMQAPAIMAIAVELRASVDPASVARAANEVVASKRYHYSFRTQPVAERMKYAMVDERVLSMLSLFFAALTTLLACAGLYGLLSYAVMRRRAEIGIRLALGAGRGDIEWMVVREAAVLLLCSLVLGIPLAFASLRLAAGALFGLRPDDPVTFTAAAVLLAAFAIAAAYVPGRRASRIDPLQTLHSE